MKTFSFSNRWWSTSVVDTLQESLLESQKEQRDFSPWLAQAVLFGLWEKGWSIFGLPALPLSHLHTSEPHCSLHNLQPHMQARTGKNATHPSACAAHSSRSFALSHSLTHTHTHIHPCTSVFVRVFTGGMCYPALYQLTPWPQPLF